MAGCADALLRMFCVPVLVRLLVLLQTQLLVMVAVQLDPWDGVPWDGAAWLDPSWPLARSMVAGWGAAALGVFPIPRKCQLGMMPSMAWNRTDMTCML